MKIIYVMGKSATGKDTIYEILKERLNAKVYISYTTRPIRKGEKDGETYNYITEQQMQKYINGETKDKLIEKRTYQTIYGPWTYATIADNQFYIDKDLIMIGTLESYQEIKKQFPNKVLPIYIEVEDGLRLERAIKRERQEEKPKYKELCRRFLADTKDFSEENIKKAGIKRRFQNIDLDKCIEEILSYIEVKEKESIEEER